MNDRTEPNQGGDPPPLAAVDQAIRRCEQADADVDLALKALRAAAPGAEFEAAWSEYERRRGALQFAIAQARVAVEDASHHHPPCTKEH